MPSEVLHESVSSGQTSNSAVWCLPILFLQEAGAMLIANDRSASGDGSGGS